MAMTIRNQDPDLKEWGVKARMISRDNTISRRFSSSRITSFREDAACKSNFTISSTASSPGYPLKEDEIDPSTYSFTNALKALQLRSINTWEYLSPEGRFALNSKWNEAERYICNPLSGEVPMECLSSKTLMNGRSFRNITNRMTMSAPLIHHSSRIQPHKLANIHPIQDDNEAKENKIEGRLMTMMMKRDVGLQSTLSESSPSPTSTPSIQERSIKFDLNLDSSNSSTKSESKSEPESESSSNPKPKPEFKDEDVGEIEETKDDEDEGERKRYGCMCKQRSGCFSFKNLWSRKIILN